MCVFLVDFCIGFKFFSIKKATNLLLYEPAILILSCCFLIKKPQILFFGIILYANNEVKDEVKSLLVMFMSVMPQTLTNNVVCTFKRRNY